MELSRLYDVQLVRRDASASKKNGAKMTSPLQVKSRRECLVARALYAGRCSLGVCRSRLLSLNACASPWDPVRTAVSTIEARRADQETGRGAGSRFRRVLVTIRSTTRPAGGPGPRHKAQPWRRPNGHLKWPSTLLWCGKGAAWALRPCQMGAKFAILTACYRRHRTMVLRSAATPWSAAAKILPLATGRSSAKSASSAAT